MADRQSILIVDDETRFRESLRDLLNDHEYETETASNGKEAIQLLSQSTFDLILLDIVMPDIDGHQVLYHIKKHYPEISVIVITGHASIESAVSALKEGAYDYIKKPFESEEIFNRIANALEQGRLKKEKEAINRELEHSQRQYRYLVQNSPDIIYTLDEKSNFSFVNTAFKQLLGYPRDKIIGKHYSSIIYQRDLEKSKHVFNERRTGKRASFGVELRLKPFSRTGQTRHGKPGEKRGALPIELKAQGLYDKSPESKDKQFLGTYGVARDIRDRKLLEVHLQQAEKMEAIGRLAGGIAHDFNNLLAAIVGNIALVKMHMNEDDEAYERMVEIEKASFRARGLTQQLITFAHGGAPVKKTGSLSELIKEAAIFVLRGSNARCKFNFPEELGSVEFDEGQINQVVQNLIINADQAMPEGGIVDIQGENVTITASYSLPLLPGKYVRISITDHGSGISTEHLHKIFDPFFTTKEGGTGFGLSTSYSIMKSHEGYIDVKSQLGTGTTFYLYFPAFEKKIDPILTTAKKHRVGKGKILFMDDEKDLRNTYSNILEKLGYTPFTVREGKEAIQSYKQALKAGEPFDAVIMDLTIPGGMGGKDAIKELLKIDPDARVIVSSGYTDNPVMANYREYGFIDVIEKPFSVEILSEILYRVLHSG